MATEDTSDDPPLRDPGMRLVPWFWNFIYILAMCVLHVRHRIEIRGGTPAPRPPLLMAAKHASGFDIPILTMVARRYLSAKPYFQMGSFIGYTVLGRIVPAMQALGGFCVMRPKEVLRLRHRKDLDHDAVRFMMNSVNTDAELTRRAVLRCGGVLAVFPEGTRNDQEVLKLRSDLEIQSALAVAGEGGPTPSIWPVVLSYGPPRFFRRRVVIDLLEPISVQGRDASGLLAEIESRFRERFVARDALG